MQLNIDLETMCAEVLDGINIIEGTSQEAAARLFRGYLTKALRTLKAVNLLLGAQLYEQAEALARILFELRVTFDYFCQMLQSDPIDACNRILDAMMLEKYKQLEAVNFAFGGHPVDEHSWRSIISDIESRHTSDDFRRMKRYGFSGISLEARARATGHLDVYQMIYRNFSRNIHSTDYAEHVGPEVLPEEHSASYLEHRNVVIFYVTHVAAAGIAEQVNSIFDCGQENTVAELAQRRDDLKEYVA